MAPKHVKDSASEMTELVLPNDTNVLGNLLGGRLLHWMDMAAAIVSYKHANRVVVTAAVDHVQFRSPIRLGEVVTLRAKITRSFTTSMEIRVDVWAEDYKINERRKANEAYYTFVAFDSTGKPTPVPPVEPETDEEKLLFDNALHRRELRLILSGKMKPGDASHLKNILELQ